MKSNKRAHMLHLCDNVEPVCLKCQIDHQKSFGFHLGICYVVCTSQF